MKFNSGIIVALLAAVSSAPAQVASHTRTLGTLPAKSALAIDSMRVTGKPVARVNGIELTDRDLLREMTQIFPYAQTHNGFPKGLEGSIRQGALQMIEFEELVYQDAERQKMTVEPQKLKRAELAFRAQFPGEAAFEQYIALNMDGSIEKFRKSVRRSLLIEAYLNSRLNAPSHVTLAATKQYYLSNAVFFTHPEQLQFQTISVMPPESASLQAKEQAKKRAQDAWDEAKNAKSYEEFGLLAEKLSEDDFRVDMGNHKLTPRTGVPPQVLQILDGMKPGQVSSIHQFGPYYVIFRLQARVPAGKTPFEQVRNKLQKDLQKERYNTLRKDLDKRLRQNAKVEEL